MTKSNLFLKGLTIVFTAAKISAGIKLQNLSVERKCKIVKLKIFLSAVEWRAQTSATTSHLLHPPPSVDSSPAGKASREGAAAVTSVYKHLGRFEEMWQIELAVCTQTTFVFCTFLTSHSAWNFKNITFLHVLSLLNRWRDKWNVLVVL